MARTIENPKELIMKKAKEILFTEGYSKLSMRALAKSCDIAIGTFYNYYPTKKDLIIEMMEEHWNQCFERLNIIMESQEDFYIKLFKIHEILKEFITSFKQVWLKPDLYDNKDYVEGGLQRQNIFIHRLILDIEKILLEEVKGKSILINLSTYDLAKFILMNFISIIQTPTYKYKNFENILKVLLK